MLAIRMQRLGRKGHPTYRVVVQDSRQTPTSGKYVAMLGSYDPHTKTTTLVKEKAQHYLDHGAQPSDRVVRLFQTEGLTLPSWVNTATSEKTRTIRNPEKLRKNQPEKPAEEAATEEPAAEASEATDEAPVAETEAPAEEAKTEEVAEAPAEEPAAETPEKDKKEA